MAAEPGPPGTPAGNRIVRAGLRRFDRLFDLIVGAFGVLYSLQTVDSFAADASGMSAPSGPLVIALVVLSVLAGLGPIVLPGRARAVFWAGVGLFAIALLLWPVAIRPPLPTDPMPWLVAVSPAPAAYAARVSSRRGVTIVGVLLLSAYTGLVLQLRGGFEAADSVVNALFMGGVAVVLVMVLGLVRRGIVAAGEAQQAALVGFATSRIDEATETERKRTDALLNDSVLTTFQSAADARTVEAERLARRMAGNALRVLLHVNGVGRQEAAMAFGQAVEEERDRLDPLLRRFDVDWGGCESIALPDDVARAIVGVLAEAVDNSVQHGSGASRRILRVEPLGPDGVRVHVEDDGCGFDPAAARGSGSGREALHRLRALEGRVDLRSAPGAGAAITVSWGSVVMVGTTPLEESLLERDGAARA